MVCPSCTLSFRPKREGAGNAGCLLHPRSRVQDALRNAHTSIQVQTEHPGVPCAMALRLMPRSPRRRIRLATVTVGLAVHRSPVGLPKTSAGLTPATGARTTRFCRTQLPPPKTSTSQVLPAKILAKAFKRRSSGAPCPLTVRTALRSRPRARRCRVHRNPSQRS